MLEFYIFTVIVTVISTTLCRIRIKYNQKIKAAVIEYRKTIEDSDPWIIKKANAIFFVAFPIVNLGTLLITLLLVFCDEEYVANSFYKVTEKRMAEKGNSDAV